MNKLTFFSLVFLVSTASLASDWTKSIRAKAHHPNRSTSIRLAQSQVEDKMRVEQAICLGGNGRFDVQYVVERCWKTLPAPGFPDEHVCVVRGDATCRFDTLAVGDYVIVLRKSALYSGSEVVGEIQEAAVYQVRAVEGDWIALKTLEGTAIKGWAPLKNLKKHTAPPAP